MCFPFDPIIPLPGVSFIHVPAGVQNDAYTRLFTEIIHARGTKWNLNQKNLLRYTVMHLFNGILCSLKKLARKL